jgi:branched-chain amino acid aminotransferase
MGLPVEERRISIDEIFARHSEGKQTEAAGVGTAATVAPIRKIKYQQREVELQLPAPDSPISRAQQQLEAIRTGNAADAHGWLVYV